MDICDCPGDGGRSYRIGAAGISCPCIIINNRRYSTVITCGRSRDSDRCITHSRICRLCLCSRTGDSGILIIGDCDILCAGIGVAMDICDCPGDGGRSYRIGAAGISCPCIIINNRRYSTVIACGRSRDSDRCITYSRICRLCLCSRTGDSGILIIGDCDILCAGIGVAMDICDCPGDGGRSYRIGAAGISCSCIIINNRRYSTVITCGRSRDCDRCITYSRICRLCLCSRTGDSGILIIGDCDILCAGIGVAMDICDCPRDGGRSYRIGAAGISCSCIIIYNRRYSTVIACGRSRDSDRCITYSRICRLRLCSRTGDSGILIIGDCDILCAGIGVAMDICDCPGDGGRSYRIGAAGISCSCIIIYNRRYSTVIACGRSRDSDSCITHSRICRLALCSRTGDSGILIIGDCDILCAGIGVAMDICDCPGDGGRSYRIGAAGISCSCIIIYNRRYSTVIACGRSRDSDRCITYSRICRLRLCSRTGDSGILIIGDCDILCAGIGVAMDICDCPGDGGRSYRIGAAGISCSCIIIYNRRYSTVIACGRSRDSDRCITYSRICRLRLCSRTGDSGILIIGDCDILCAGIGVAMDICYCPGDGGRSYRIGAAGISCSCIIIYNRRYSTVIACGRSRDCDSCITYSRICRLRLCSRTGDSGILIIGDCDILCAGIGVAMDICDCPGDGGRSYRIGAAGISCSCIIINNRRYSTVITCGRSRDSDRCITYSRICRLCLCSRTGDSGILIIGDCDILCAGIGVAMDICDCPGDGGRSYRIGAAGISCSCIIINNRRYSTVIACGRSRDSDRCITYSRICRLRLCSRTGDSGILIIGDCDILCAGIGVAMDICDCPGDCGRSYRIGAAGISCSCIIIYNRLI